MTTDSPFRAPTFRERALLEKLMEADFPGKSQLRILLSDVLVKRIDENGSLAIECSGELRAPVIKRIPVEGEQVSSDGTIVHTLLHVVDGRPTELEFYRDDGKQILDIPDPKSLQVIVLPSSPAGGWVPPGP